MVQFIDRRRFISAIGTPGVGWSRTTSFTWLFRSLEIQIHAYVKEFG